MTFCSHDWTGFFKMGVSFNQAKDEVLQFRDKRDWSHFHNPKDLAISISLEAAELLELFQWSGEDIEVEQKQADMKDELADIMIYCIYMADKLGIDVAEAISEKVAKNDAKYPAEKARGVARKYTEL